MKRPIVLGLICATAILVAGSAAAQTWNTPSGTFTTTTNVGVKMPDTTTTPAQALQVDGSTVLHNDMSQTGLNNAYFIFNQSPSSGWWTYSYGMTLGFNNNRYRTLLFAPDAADIAFSTHVGGTAPTGQSSFTERMTIAGNSGNVGVGTVSPNARLDLSDTTQHAERLQLSGTEYYAGNTDTGGVALLLGVNRPQNRQLWIADSAVTGTTANNNAVLRLMVGTVPVIDAISTDGATQQNFQVGGPSATVGVGFQPPAGTGYRLDVNGTTHISGNLIVDGTVNHATYNDIAEWVPSTKRLSAGTVVVLDPSDTNQVKESEHAYDTAVAGVVSAAPGFVLGSSSDTKSEIATLGRVRVKVDATKHPVHVGDLLVTSDTPGMAMVSEPIDIGGTKIHRPGTLIGKALEPLTGGTGEVLVLLSLQ